MKKSLFKKSMATALSVVMALGSSVYAFAEGETTEEKVTYTLKLGAAALELEEGTGNLEYTSSEKDQVTIETTCSDTDDASAITVESSNKAIAEVAVVNSNKHLSVKGVAPGVVTATVKYGDQTAELKITVTEKDGKYAAPQFNMSTTFDKLPLKDGKTQDGKDPTDITSYDQIWAGGGKKADGGKYNTAVIYSNAVPLETDIDVTNDIVTDVKAGKVLVGVSAKLGTTETPATCADVFSGGKIVKDADAAQILKANYKVAKGASNGTLTLTAGKKAGSVLVWVIQVDAKGNVLASSALRVDVKGAAKKINIGSVVTEDGKVTGFETVKNAAVVYNSGSLTEKEVDKVVVDDEEIAGSQSGNVGATYDIQGLLADKTTEVNAADVTYKAEIAAGGEAFITADIVATLVDTKDKTSVEVVGSEGYTNAIKAGSVVTAYALNIKPVWNAAATAKSKTKVTVTNVESGAKATISVQLTNPIEGGFGLEFVKPTEENKLNSQLIFKGNKVQFNVNELTASELAKRVPEDKEKEAPDVATTDKLKVYVNVRPQAKVDEVKDKSGNVITPAQEEIKAPSYNAETKKIENLAPSKAVKAAYKNGVLTVTRVDPTQSAMVYIAATDPVTKVVRFFEVLDVDAVEVEDQFFSAILDETPEEKEE